MRIVFAFCVSGAEIGNVLQSEGDFLVDSFQERLKGRSDSPCWNKFVTENARNEFKFMCIADDALRKEK